MRWIDHPPRFTHFIIFSCLRSTLLYIYIYISEEIQNHESFFKQSNMRTRHMSYVSTVGTLTLPLCVVVKKLPLGRPEFTCDECGDQFRFKRDLQTHYIKARHTNIHYMCAWCDQVPQRQFRLSHDLARHIKTKHACVSPPKKAFSRMNCFFYTQSSSEFIKLYGHPDGKGEEAIFAQESVRLWCCRNGKEDEMSLWQRRWAGAEVEPLPTCTSSGYSTPCSSVHSASLCSPSPLGFDLDESPIPSLSLITPISPCSPSYPLVGQSAVPLSSQINISSPIYHQQPSTYLPVGSSSVPIPANTTISSPSYNPLSPTYTQSQSRPTITFSSVDKVISPSPTYNPESPSYHPTMAMFESQFSTYDLSSPVIKHPTYHPTPIHRSPNTTDSSLVDVSPSPANPITSTVTTSMSLVNIVQTLVTKLPTPTTWSPASTALLAVNTTPLPLPTTNSTPPPIQVSSVPTPLPTPEKDVKSLARELLTTGAMPLLPPARRDWNYVPDNLISLTPTLSWPPSHWKSFTPDQKTLAAEFAANTLEQSSPIYRPISRSNLLFKHNYLVLPGSIVHKLDTNGHRLYTSFNTIRLIALGKSSLAHNEQRQLVEAFHRSPSSITSLLRNIPLRI